tara:strand:+ start:1220 stop:2179 length:960 start_codon:yes stop_codon:yes gene_type:complete
MKKFKCLITDYQGDNCNYEIEQLEKNNIETVVAKSKNQNDWFNILPTVDAILTRHANIDEKSFAMMEKCKVISRYGTGYDNIDINSAQKKKIIITFVDDYCSNEVADHTLLLILYCIRNLRDYLSSVSKGDWTPNPHPNVERISGKKMTVIGYGKIGQKVVERALAFGFEMRVYDPYYKGKVPSGVSHHKDIYDAVLDTDVVSLHVPLIESTKNIIDKKVIDLMSQDSLLVNVARGGLIKLDDAISSLDKNKLGWLALDVADNEPPKKSDILRSHKKVVLTPHIAYYSKQSIQESKRICVENIILGLNNKQVIGPVVKF